MQDFRCCLADDFCRCIAQHPFGAGVEQGNCACRIGRDDRELRRCIEDGAQLLLEPEVLSLRLLVLPIGQAKLQKGYGLSSKSAERLSCRSDEGHVGIKANVRRARDQRVVGKPVTPGGIRHDEQARLENGVGAKGDVTGCFRRVDADFRFEPLPVRIDQADERNRYVQICVARVVRSSNESSGSVSRTW